MNPKLNCTVVYRRFLLATLVVGLLFGTGCRQQETVEEGAPSKSQPVIAVVPKGLLHQFWLTVKAGAEHASKEYGAKMLWKGPSVETDIAGQMTIIEDFISRNVDAIVMAATDAKALVPVVQRAHEAGIPVVTIDSGVDSEIPVSFVATDNIAGARAAARTLADLIGGTGEVGLIPFVPGAATSMLREKGFKDGIAEIPGIELVSVLYSQSSPARGMEVTENMLTSHPELKGIFAANEPGAVGCAQALESRGLTGTVKVVAFDASEIEIDALKRGAIQALIVQNPFKMGYEGVKTAMKTMRGEPVEKRIDTGVTVVTMENFNEPKIQELLFPLGET